MTAAIQSAEMRSSRSPADFDSANRQRLVKDGERRLLWAVLEDGIRSYLEHKPCANRKESCEFLEVRRWFEPGEDAAQGPFSFGSICDQFGIDARQLLVALRSFDGHKARGPGASPEVLAA